MSTKTLTETTVWQGAYGKELRVESPLFPKNERVTVAQDIFGESKEMLQFLIYPATPEEDPAICIRFNLNGTIAEISMPEKYRALVRPAEALIPSPWLVERDGH